MREAEREILFRGQSRRKGERVWMNGSPVDSEWKYGGIFPQNEGEDKAIIYQQEPEVEKFVVYSDTVCEYTGLRDVDGTRIFEKDLCRDSLGNIFIVKWDQNNARFLGYGKDGRIYYVGREPRVKVIGNIFDDQDVWDKTPSERPVR